MMTPPLGHPKRLDLQDLQPAPAPVKRWRAYIDRTEWWGIGLLYIPHSDFQVAFGPWVLGVECAEVDADAP
jgi:hypothetical protein